MNFFGRAIKNVTRKMTKSILLGLTFLMIGNFVIIGIGISNAAENAKTITRQSMTPVVSYEIDYEAFYEYVNSIEDEELMNEASRNYPKISAAELQELVKDKRVSTASALSIDNIYTARGTTYAKLNNQAEENQEMNDWRNPDIIIKSNLIPDMIELHDGTYTILEGRFYTQEEIDNFAPVALVSSAFAESNGLSLGDTFYVAYRNAQEYTDPKFSPYEYDVSSLNLTEDSFTGELEVIGIYDNADKILPGNERYDFTYPFENPENIILTPPNALRSQVWEVESEINRIELEYYSSLHPEWYEGIDMEEISTKEYYMQTYISTATILLNDPLDLDSFVEDLMKNAPDYRKVSVDNSSFEKFSRPLDTISLFADFIVWLVIINAVVIITLVTALTLKTREYEIGVLLALGTNKLKIVAQFFVELAVVAVLGFTLAVGTGSLISKKIGNVVLDYVVSSSYVNEIDDSNDFDSGWYDPWNTNYSSEVTLDDFISQYEVTISPSVIVMVYGVGLAITLVSIVVPSAMIMRFNPKKILMNQN